MTRIGATAVALLLATASAAHAAAPWCGERPPGATGYQQGVNVVIRSDWTTNCESYADMAAAVACARDHGITESQAIESMPTPPSYERSAAFYQLVGEVFETSPRPTPDQIAAVARAQCSAPNEPEPRPVAVDNSPTPPNTLVIPIPAR